MTRSRNIFGCAAGFLRKASALLCLQDAADLTLHRKTQIETPVRGGSICVFKSYKKDIFGTFAFESECA